MYQRTLRSPMETPMTYFMEDPKPEDVIFYKKY